MDDTAEAELARIHERIVERGAAETADRTRQRELMRAMRAREVPATIDAIQAAAQVSRPTVIAALKRAD